MPIVPKNLKDLNSPKKLKVKVEALHSARKEMHEAQKELRETLKDASEGRP